MILMEFDGWIVVFVIPIAMFVEAISHYNYPLVN